MKVQLRPDLIREARGKRAWTQEHLAELTGLGVRTVQRIEATGLASHESAAALSSVLSIPLHDLQVQGRTGPRSRWPERRAAWRTAIALGMAAVAVLLLSPPSLAVAMPLLLVMFGAYAIGRTSTVWR